MPAAPVQFAVETDRLRLRHWTPADLAAAIELFTNERSTWDMGGARPEAAIRAWHDRCVEASRMRTTWQWALEHKADGRIIGFCGPKPQNVDDEERLEIGYRLLPDYWGQGLASEAARCVRDYVFEELREPEVICIIRPNNERSIRVAEGLGMTIEKETVYKGFEVRIYQLGNPGIRGVSR